MQKLTRAQAKELIIKKNSTALLKIIRDSKKAIIGQGTGCFIENYGVDYVDTKRNIRDSIGVLVPFYSNGKLKRHYGLIESESQKPIVRVIQKTYRVDVSRDSEYERFTRILQKLQDAHDTAFDSGRNDMNLFVDLCNKLIEEDLKWNVMKMDI
jgi:hypothetical protein